MSLAVALVDQRKLTMVMMKPTMTMPAVIMSTTKTWQQQGSLRPRSRHRSALSPPNQRSFAIPGDDGFSFAGPDDGV